MNSPWWRGSVGISLFGVELGETDFNGRTRGPHARTTKLDNLDDVIAVTDIEMEPDDLDYLAETYRPRPVLGRG
ncbi:MAG: hypothetical protein KY462_05065 [Actinobacteria bacterium]|nr:hypothetical protein [Actinomycetota bacterium]